MLLYQLLLEIYSMEHMLSNWLTQTYSLITQQKEYRKSSS